MAAERRTRISDVIAPVFLPVHRAIRDGKAAEIWLDGGRGSTKSSFVSLEIVLGLLRDPEANAIIYRKVAATLRESVYAQMLWAINRLGLHDFFRAKRSPLEIEYKPTGQRVMFRGADDPGKSKSIKLQKGYFKFLWFEELTEFSGMEDIRTIKASVIRGGRPESRGDSGATPWQAVTLYSYNPPASARNWVNAEALKPRDGRLKHHSSYLDVPRAWLGESFIAEAEALRASNERVYRHVYLGEVTGTGGQVFENVAARTVTDEEIKSFGRCYMGLDFGWYPDPLHWVRCAYMPAQKRLVVFDELRANKLGNYEAARKILTEKKAPREEVICDSAEMKSIADLREYGLAATPAVKGPGSVTAGMKWLQSRSEIVIDPARCPWTAKEFLEYEYDRDGKTGEVLEGYPDHDNHAIDAVRYALNRVWMTRGM